ncbi:MAG: lytic transglycosylase domain-containing protein [Acidimicrobiales bacterium]
MAGSSSPGRRRPGSVRSALRFGLAALLVADLCLLGVGLAVVAGGSALPAAGRDHVAGAGDQAAPGPGSSPAPAGDASGSTAPGPSPLASQVATDPAGLADQLASALTAISDPATPAADLSRLGQLEQLDYGALGANRDWQPVVLAALPAHLQGAASLVVDAGNALDALDSGTPASDTLPDWSILAPLPAATLLGYYHAAGAATGVPWSVLAAINLIETRLGRIHGDSPAGAQGPMQFIPTTWAIYGEGGNIDSSADAIPAAARLLAAEGAPADMAGAVYHYNASHDYVTAVLDYAEVMDGDPRAFSGFYQWQVFVTTRHGDLLLPVGYRPAS